MIESRVNAVRCAELLKSFPEANVLVLGDVMLDRFIYGSIDRISPEAPIPVMREERVRDMPGGAGNVARNCAAMHAGGVTLIAAVGTDEMATQLQAGLATLPGLDIRLVADDTRPTTVKTRYVAARQQMLRIDRESTLPVDDHVAQRILVEFEAALPRASVVVLSDYAKGTLTDSLLTRVIQLARSAGKPVIVDPKSRSFSRYRGATILTPNRLELQAATGQECASDEQVAKAARLLLEAGICDALVVTRGPEGMSVVDRVGAVHLATVAQEVFDVSGAGDTALSALALGIAAGGNVTTAASLANIAAGIVVSKVGTAVATHAEIAANVELLSDVSSEKLYTVSRTLQLVADWRENGLTIAFTNGCFDLLHPGHIALLTKARKTADRLVVGLNSDASVRQLKGPGRPVQGEMERAAVLASLKPVDAVVLFSDATPIELIRALEPDVLIKGSDYTVDKVVGSELILARGGRVVLIDLVTGHSTTSTVRRLAVASGA